MAEVQKLANNDSKCPAGHALQYATGKDGGCPLCWKEEGVFADGGWHCEECNYTICLDC